jgi:hypothetical protein
MTYEPEESTVEHLRRAVQKYLDARDADLLRDDIVGWLSWYPAKVREAIYLIIDGHQRQDHRAHVKGAETARARRRKGEA